MSRPETGSGGDFWSRRRAAVAAETQADRRAEEQAQDAEARAALEEKSDAEILDALGLQDPDTLAHGDDFSAFLRSEVPDRLRRRALRRLWRSNPVLANLDSLVDYGEDFTDAATVVENMQTAYRVGKGMLAHIEAQLEAASEEAAADVAEEDVAAVDEGRQDQADASQIEPDTVGDHTRARAPLPEAPGSPETQQNQSERGALTQEETLPSPRRMRFVYGAAPEESP
ncbi:MAG: DUF3306 domain-containing protein [Pseudomonadota bacterium]